MRTSLSLLLVLAASLVIMGCDLSDDGVGGGSNQVQLQNHSVTPSFAQLNGAEFPGVQAYTLFSSEDQLPQSPDFVFGGSPDGAGLIPNPEGSGYIYVSNNEDNYSISRITFDDTFRPVKGDYLVNSDQGRWRLCSGTLITPEEHGFGPAFFSAGESGEESQIHLVDPFGDLNESRLLPALGRHSTENAVPFRADTFRGKTVIVIGEDESGPRGGQIHLYVGDGTGNLTTGDLYAMVRTDENQRERDIVLGEEYEVEFRQVVNPEFTSTSSKSQETMTGEEISAYSFDELKAVGFGRVEDLDLGQGSNSNKVFFNVTGYNWDDQDVEDPDKTVWGRTYELTLDPNDPLKGTIKVILDGDNPESPAYEFYHNPDNIVATENYLYIQEDPNGYTTEEFGRTMEHDANIYQYDIQSGDLKVFAEINPLRGTKYAPADARLGSWETGAMVDVSDVIGVDGAFTLNIQSHTWQSSRCAGADGGARRQNEDECGMTMLFTGVPR